MKRSGPRTHAGAIERNAAVNRRQRKSTLPNGFIFGVNTNGELTITNTKSGAVTVIA